jgi:4a-hydroxytetrahydrobiopterin dehydratase
MTSSSNRTAGHCDAVLAHESSQPSEESGSTTSGSTASGSNATGPLRLPLEEPESFVSQFNRIYSRIGLTAQVVPATDSQPHKLSIQRTTMSNDINSESLRKKRCVPCEGGVPVIKGAQALKYLQSTPTWSISDDGKMISRKLNASNFIKAMAILQMVADLAEQEQHHPDFHLTGYRHLRIDLTTHAIGGLSENDFILAAKIDTLLG